MAEEGKEVKTFAPTQQGPRNTSLRTHSCGALRLSHVGQTVTLAGWVQKMRDMNHFAFVDVRDRYGITQAVFQNQEDTPDDVKERYARATKLGREFVVSITGVVTERSNKNPNRPTGDIEIVVTELKVINASITPPFTIEDETDGGEEIRLKYRYLDIRRNPIREALIMRANLAATVRGYLGNLDFVEIETPVLIKSTPEGARDFVVPSRMNPGKFYALPQSPQTFKQILMVGGIDRYYQIVKCFRDEELRSDRQPEFTQIDCEMAFVSQEDILTTFEGLMTTIFKKVVNHTFETFPRMTYADAMQQYGIDKPDTRFEMKLTDVTALTKGKGLRPLDESEVVVAIAVPTYGTWSNKKIKTLEKIATSTDVNGRHLIWIKAQCLEEGKLKLPSSAKKFFNEADLFAIVQAVGAKKDDLVCIMGGPEKHYKTHEAMGKFRNLMGEKLGFKKFVKGGFKALWVYDFPLLEYDDEAKRYNAMHHPFTSPYEEDLPLLETAPEKVRAYAYDMVINGVEIGGGSIRIHDRAVQAKMFDLLGFTKEEAQAQFGFLLGAFEYGAPPHGGLAFGFDRLCTILGGKTSIREYIAFPKNNQGRDTMIAAPDIIADAQLTELSIKVDLPVPDEPVVDEAKVAA